MKRRDFVLRSAAMVVGAGLGRVDLAAARVPPVRVAVVGTGGRGTELVRKLSTIEGAAVVAVCDDYAPHLERAAAAAGSRAEAYASYTAMLRGSSPQAVLIATPLHLHHPMAMEAIAAGADVFCEKTMCYSTAEALELAAAVRRHGTVLQVGLQRRASPIYLQAKAMIDAGAIGRVTAIRSQWHRNDNWRRPVPVPRGHPEWPTLERRLNWRLFHATSRGLLTELGSHQFDVANWMLDAVPTRAIGSGGTDYLRDGREVFDNVFCVHEYRLTPPGGEPYTVRASYSAGSAWWPSPAPHAPCRAPRPGSAPTPARRGSRGSPPSRCSRSGTAPRAAAGSPAPAARPAPRRARRVIALIMSVSATRSG
jgi:predicted dehydrogenase